VICHPLDGLELPALAFTQRLVAVHLQRREVTEVDLTVVAGYPAVTFLVLPPSDRAGQEMRCLVDRPREQRTEWRILRPEEVGAVERAFSPN